MFFPHRRRRRRRRGRRPQFLLCSGSHADNSRKKEREERRNTSKEEEEKTPQSGHKEQKYHHKKRERISQKSFGNFFSSFPKNMNLSSFFSFLSGITHTSVLVWPAAAAAATAAAAAVTSFPSLGVCEFEWMSDDLFDPQTPTATRAQEGEDQNFFTRKKNEQQQHQLNSLDNEKKELPAKKTCIFVYYFRFFG